MINKLLLSDIKRVKEASETGELVVFVGAGLSMTSGMPSWTDLIDSFKAELSEQLQKESDFLKISQIYKNYRGETEYLRKVKNVLYESKPQPNPIHDLILDLNPAHIITTNYDDLLEQAIRKRTLNYFVIKQDSDLPKSPVEKYLIKMHGDIDEGNIVLCEQDYLDYQSNFPLLQALIQSLVATKTILFIGFSFSDYNLKIITNMVMNALGKNFPFMYLLDHHEKENIEIEYLKNRGVKTMPFETGLLDEGIEFPKSSTFQGTSVSYKISVLLEFVINSDQLIKKHDLNDFLSEVESLIDSISNDINYLGPSGILNILKKKWDFEIEYNDFELTFYDSFLLKYTAEFSVKKWTYKREIQSLSKIYKYLANNSIHKIVFRQKGKKPLYTKKMQKYFYQDKKLTPFLFSEYKFEEISNTFNSLKNNPYNSTGLNLFEYPFLLYKMGYYFDAIKEFDYLRIKFVSDNQPVLLLFALYNIKQLLKLIRNEQFFGNNRPLWDGNLVELKQRLGDVDYNIKEVVSKLRFSSKNRYLVDSYMRVVDYSFVNEIIVKLNDDLYRLRRAYQSYLFGGSDSYNFHLKTFLGIFEIENWTADNYLVSDVFLEHKKAHTISFEIFILLHKVAKVNPINTGVFSGIQMLPKLDFMHLRFAIELVEKDLKNIIKSNGITEIILTNDALTKLQELFNTFYNELINPKLAWNFSDWQSQCLDNIMRFLTLSDARQESLILVVGKILETDYRKLESVSNRSFINSLTDFFNACDTSAYYPQINELIEKFIQAFNFNSENVDILILTLIHNGNIHDKQFKLSKSIMNRIREIEIYSKYIFEIYCLMYNMVRRSEKPFYFKKIDDKLNSAEDNYEKWGLIALTVRKKISISTSLISEFLIKMKTTLTDSKKTSYDQLYFSSIKEISIGSMYTDFNKELKQLKSSTAHLHFVIDPESFNEYEKVERDWIFSEEIYKPHLESREFKKAIRKMIDDNKEDSTLRDFYIQKFN